MIKYQIRKLVRKAAGWPVVGRLVRIGVAVIRLPEERVRWNGGAARQGGEFEHVRQAFETQQLPTLLDNLSDVNHRQIQSDIAHQNLVQSVPVALRAFARELAELRGRVDALSGATPKVTGGPASPSAQGALQAGAPRIANPDKLQAARKGELRVNLADAGTADDGYVNVGDRAQAGVDVVADAGALPFAPGEVAEIACSRVLQRYSDQRLRDEILPHFHSLLKPGGTLRIVVADAQAFARQYANGDISHDQYRSALYGTTQALHANTFTSAHLQQLLREAGFDKVRVVDDAARDAAGELDVLAEK